MLSPSRSVRRGLAAAALAASSLAGVTSLGTTPAGAIVPPQCLGSEARQFVCASYGAFVDRTPSQEEVDYWVPSLPAKRSFFLATLGRSLESRQLMIEEYYWDFADRSVDGGEVEYWAGEVLGPNGFRRLEAALYGGLGISGEDLVDWAYYGLIGRDPTVGEVEYWGDRAEATSATQMAAALAGTPESRNTRVRFTYANELGYFPDTASRDYWSERLRTGTSWLDVRIGIKASPDGYPEGSGCSSLAPPVRPECLPD